MRLLIIDEEGESQAIELAGDLLRIGRASGNDIVLPDVFVSRHHADLRRGAAGWEVIDHSSKSGTFVNGEKVSQQAIRPGDELRLGYTRMLLEPTGRLEETVIALSDELAPESTIRAVSVPDDASAGLSALMVAAAREITSDDGTDEVLTRLLGLALRATGAERGAVATFTEEGGIEPAAVRGQWTGDKVVISRQVLARVRDRGEAVIVEDIPSDESLKDAGTIIRAGVRSVLCTPLGRGKPAPGLLYLDSQVGQVSFQPSHFEVVATLASMIGIRLENEEARREREAREAFRAQLSAAAEIQARLLPPVSPEAPAGFSVAGRHRSCLTVGGDFFDFFTCHAGFGTVLADVAGKGLSAALLMANFHAVWHHLRGSHIPLEQWLETLNRELIAYLPENRFITLAFAVIDAESGELVFASAGHNPAPLFDGEKVTELPATGPVLGLIEDAPFEILRRPFPPGSRLLLYSDGVTDQQNAEGSEFGQAKLFEGFAGLVDGSAGEIVEQLEAALESYSADAEQDDDITFAVLGRT